MTRRALWAGLALLVLGGTLAGLAVRGGDPAARSDADADGPSAEAPAPHAAVPGAVLAARPAGEAVTDVWLPPPPEPSSGPTILGVVVDPEGRAVAQAEVRVHTELDPRAARTGLLPRERTGTDSDGRFSLSAVPEVTRWLEVDGRPELSTRVVRVGAGEREVRVALERRRVVTVTVLDPEGRPLRGALASVTPVFPTVVRPDPDFHWKPPGSDWSEYLARLGRGGGEATTDRAGVARIRVDPGRTTAGARPPLDADALPTSGVPVEGESVVVRLDPAFEITGRALDGEGKPVPEAYVAWRMRGERWKSTRVDEDGRFAIGRLAKGVVEIRAQIDPAPPDPDGPGVEVATGAKDLALTVDPGAELRVQIEDWPPSTTGTIVLFSRPWSFARIGRLEAPISTAGEAVFRGLRRDGGYFFQVWTADRKRTATWRGPFPADARVSVRLTESGSIRVILDAPSPVAVIAVDVDGFATAPAYAPPPHEEFLLERLPRGPVRLEVQARTLSTPAQYLSGTAEGEVPGTVRVRLELVPERRPR